MQKGLPPAIPSKPNSQQSDFTVKHPQASARREDNEAQLEMLRNMKIFLTDKVKKSDEVIKTLENDVDILKNYLRVEKAAH